MDKNFILAYKGFGLDWKCRDFQFELGKSYKHDGKVKACSSGFHSCKYPLDCFGYYEPGTSVYAVVEAGGETSTHTEDSKIASSKITIKAALTIPMLVSAAIEYTTSRCDPINAQHSKGDRSASSATGDRSASSATGYQSASSATGYQSASSATGNRSASSATGNNSVAMNIGVHGKAMADKDGAIVLCNHDDNGSIRHIRASKVGENGIKPRVFYILNDAGEFEEAI